MTAFTEYYCDCKRLAQRDFVMRHQKTPAVSFQQPGGANCASFLRGRKMREMRYPKFKLMLLVAVAALALSYHVVAADTLFSRKVTLIPGHLQLLWNPGQEYLMLKIEVKTRGYFALTFSNVHEDPNDTQDALLGWTDDSEVLLQDAVVLKNGKLLADKSNDYELLEGARNDSDFLSVTVQRRWSTCDQLEDMPLGAGSVLVSWAVYSKIPDNLEEFARLDEGERHGSQIVVFNAPPKPLPPETGLRVWPIMLPKIQLTSNSTWLRWCAMFHAPETKNKHWIVGAKPNINQPDRVKKIILYECRDQNMEMGSLSPGQAGRACIRPDSIPNACKTIALIWTSGNDVIMFPNDIGIPVGINAGGTDFYLLQVSYSQMDSSEILNDSSGLNVLLTSKKPKHQASVLQVGLDPSALLVIPPRQPATLVRGWCLQQCLNKLLQASPRSEVSLTSILVHRGHSALRKVVLRHLQDTDELPPILIELGYQSETQEILYMDPKRRVRSTDNLALECEFNSQDRDRTVMGGESSEDEMCVAYILYHPRTALASCTSNPQVDKILEILTLKGKFNTHDPYLSSQPSLRDSLLNFDWGAKNITSKIEQLQNEILKQTTTPKCFNAYGDMLGTESNDLPLYQEQLVAMSKITRCGIWNTARGHERQRSSAILTTATKTLIINILILLTGISTLHSML